MQGMRSDASFKKISFPLDKPSRWGQFIGTPCGEIQPKKPKNQKKQQKERQRTPFLLCVFFWRIVFCWVFLTQQNGVRWAPRKKTKKNNNTADQTKKVARCD